jgi:hypothetical protein
MIIKQHLNRNSYMKIVQPLTFLLLVTSLAITVSAQKKTEPTVTVKKFAAPNAAPDEATFLKNNPSVKEVFWQKGNKIVVVLKAGEKKTYALSKLGESKAFTDLYGVAPKMPPPPPPVAPPPPPPPPIEKKH